MIRIVSTYVTILLVAAHAAQGQARPDSASRSRDTTRRAPSVLPAMEVRASIIPSAGPTVGSGVPARVSTIAGAAVDAWRPRLLADVLATRAGVSLYDDLGTPWKLNLSSRGFTTGPTVGLPPGITVFVDGVRQNEPDAQEVNFDLLPTDHVERIELLSGTASLLGPNSLGGAINLVTSRGSGVMSGELETSVASFGAYRGQGTIQGATAGGWDYYASGGAGREGGWRSATGDRNYNSFLNVGRGGTSRGVRLQAYASQSRAETAGSLPETIFRRDPVTNFTPGDFENLDAQQLSLSGYSSVGPGHGSFTMYGRRSSAERFNVNQAPDPNVRSFTNNRTAGGTIDWRWTDDVGPGTLAARVGVDGAANWVRARIFNEPQTAGALADDRDLTTDVRSPSWDLASYGLVDYRAGRVTVSTGIRVDRVAVPFHNLLHTDDNATNTYSHASPRAGVSFDLGRGGQLYTSVGQSFRAPAILELGCADPEATCPLPFALGDDPPLAPVAATSYEVGGRWIVNGVSVTGSLYRTNVRDEIFFVASSDALLSGYFTNLARTRREGAEVEANGTALGERADWYANYALTRATFRSATRLFSIRSDDDFEDSPLAGSNDVRNGNTLPLVPDHQIKAGVSLRPMWAFDVGFDARWVGRQWLRGDEANQTSRLDDYAQLNVRSSVDVRGWRIIATVTNLFDSHRAIFGTFNENRSNGTLERFLTPMNARAYALTVRRALGRT